MKQVLRKSLHLKIATKGLGHLQHGEENLLLSKRLFDILLLNKNSSLHNS
jgi:hypothetical protein